MTPTPHKTTRAGWVITPIAILIVVATVWIFSLAGSSAKKAEADQKAKAAAQDQVAEHARTHPQQSAPTGEAPLKVRATTPATITADYGFSLEADAPIMVQYPGEKPFLFNPGKAGDCQQLPQPRDTGPKKFWDPNDKENGHISFRIYRGKGMCE